MVGRGTPEPKRSGTLRKTSNGNGGRTENPPALDVGSANHRLKNELRSKVDYMAEGKLAEESNV